MQGLGIPHTASPTTWPSFAPIHLKVERFGARKSPELEGCRERLAMLSHPPPDGFAPREAQQARGFAAHSYTNQQTSGSGSLIPVPAQGRDGIF